MNRIVIPLLGILFLLIGCAPSDTPTERVIMWLDATANFERLGTEEGIIAMFDKCRAIGVTDLILDVKPISGHVLYPSQYAPLLREWNGYVRDENFDFINTAIKHAHARGMKLHVAFNIFSEGHKYISSGTIYETHPEWQTVLYTPQGILPITEYEPGYSAFTNPLLAEVQQHQLNIIREVAETYAPDGIVLDRCRFNGLNSDFSEYTRGRFEQYLHETRGLEPPQIRSWPEDIFTWVEVDGSYTYEPGRFFKEWLEFRAAAIKDFVERARETVKSVDPSMEFTNYVGAWYPVYYELGVNWASVQYDPSQDYDWATPEYKYTGFAELFDWLMVGTYFYEVTIEELQEADRLGARTEDAMGEGREFWYSVEGSSQIARTVTMGVIPIYGSLYVEQYKWKDNPEQFRRAVEMARRETDGVMIFDISHLEDFGYWDYLERGLRAAVR